MFGLGSQDFAWACGHRWRSRTVSPPPAWLVSDFEVGRCVVRNQTNPGDEKCPTCRRDILVPVIWQVVGMRYSGVSHPTDSAGIRKTQTSSSGGFKISCTSSIVVCLAHKLLKSEYTRDAQETANRPFEIPLVADNTDQQFFVPLLVLLPPLLRRCRNRLRRTH